VNEGDWIGLVRGDGVVAIGDSPVAAATSLLDHIIGESGELLTLIAGRETTAQMVEEVVAYVKEKYPGVETEVHPGGQPLYPFLFGVE
jgi:dihydroxyacetone kinase-like predicted kinase